MSDEPPLYRTPLYERHLAAGARMVEFSGWQMPVHYTSVVEEHRAVRAAAGLFDVSHMGEIRLRGTEAESLLERLTPNHVARLTPGRAHYSGLLTEEGTYLDDLLVYRLAADDFLLVVNAVNTAGDLSWITSQANGPVRIEDVTAEYALLAIQGPAAEEILQELTPVELPRISYYGFVEGRVAGARALISRTGYTGEDGFELYLPAERAAGVWDRLLAIGGDHGLVPAGLGARDTLRLEAAMALYGHEIDRTTTPLEAGLAWVVKFDKGEFIGRRALLDQKRSGVARKLVGFEVVGRGIARQSQAVLVEGETVGRVTSGTWSPTFERALGMAYVDSRVATPRRQIEIDVRGRRVEGVVVELPFYRRAD